MVCLDLCQSIGSAMTLYKALYVQLVFDGRCLDDSRTVATFTRSNELPFVPCAGLIIDFGGLWPNKIDRVIWCPETEEFKCPMVNIFCDPEGLTFDEWIDSGGSRHGWDFIDRREYSTQPMSEAEIQARREHRDPVRSKN